MSAPDDIAPERIEDAFDVLAERWAEKRGVELPPGSYVSINAPLSADQLAELKRAIAEGPVRIDARLLLALARLPDGRGLTVAAGLIPALLPVARECFGSEFAAFLDATDDQRQQVALAIIDRAIGELTASASQNANGET